MGWKMVALLLVLAGGVAAKVGWDRGWAAWHLAGARAATEREDLELAKAHYAESLRYRPNQALATYELARVVRRAGDYHEARRQLKLATDFGYDPDRVALEAMLVDTQLAGWRSNAERLMARIVAGDPDRARIHEVMAFAFANENLLDRGLTEVEKWLELEPNSPTAWELCGMLYERYALPDKALDAYVKATALDVNRFKAHVGAGSMAYARSQMDLATHHFRAAVALQPNDREARIGLARVLANTNFLDEAKTHIDHALALEPDQYQVLGTAGHIAMQRNDFPAALKYFQAATAVVGDPKILMDYRLCLARMKRFDEARALDARIKMVEDDLERIATLRVKLDDLADPKPRVEVGVLLIKHGLYNEGRSWLQEALKLNPNYPPAHAALADLFEKLGRPDRAAHHRERAK